MKALIINGSPKRKGSTSGFLGRLTGCFLPDWKVWHASVRTQKEFPEILRHLQEADVLILTVPLYVDGIPSHVIEFLQEAEKFCTENSCHCSCYVISNCGFIEGKHNKVHLDMYECWCRRIAIPWGGGLGVGGGEMFHVLSVIYPAVFAGMILVNLIRIGTGEPVDSSGWMPLARNLAVYLFFNMGVFFSIIRLAINVRRIQKTENRYTRVMVPAFLFIPMADIFMILTALFHGKNIFSLLKKDVYAPGDREHRGAGRQPV